MKLHKKYIILGIDYSRWKEYPLVTTELMLERGTTLLDIGSKNSIFPLFLISQGVKVYATDIDKVVFTQRKNAEKLELPYQNLTIDIQDARTLTYPDESFERISAISVLEHLQNNDDIKAAKEIGRVLKVGGRAVITVPFSAKYHDRNLNVPYYERLYDVEAMHKRLIESSRLSIVNIKYFGETRFNFSKYWYSLPNNAKLIISWMQPIISEFFLTEIEQNRIDRAIISVITLKK